MPDDYGRPLPGEELPDSNAPYGHDDLGLPRLSPEKNQEELHRYGTELLKRGMLENLGVDYQSGGPYDDTPTIEDRLRRAENAGQPDVFDLQEQERKMEGVLGGPRQVEPRETAPLPRNINLEPVEHNPFGVTLMPVDHDPFSRG